MAKFCGRCGAVVKNGICTKCGALYHESAPFVLYECREKAIKKIKTHIIVNCVLWICLGTLQLFDIRCVHGMFYVNTFGDVLYRHILGVWNIAVSICEIYASYNIRSKASMFVSKWEKSLVAILVVCIINLLIGSFIGFVLNLHTLYIRYVIDKNKMLLISI